MTSLVSALAKRNAALVASAVGAAIVGFHGPVPRTVEFMLDMLAGGIVNVCDKKYAGGADKTGVALSRTALLAAIADVAAISQGYQTKVGTSPVITGGYVNVAPVLHIPPGLYDIDDKLDMPSYLRIDGYGAIIRQRDATKNILNGATAYQWSVAGLGFEGGKNQVYLENANLDVTHWTFDDCNFSLSASSTIKTAATGGASSHLSANLVVRNCTFYKPNKVCVTVCDSATFENCWVFMHADTVTQNTAFFTVGTLTTDGYPNLYLKNMFGVPSMGTGVGRPAMVRWIDHLAGKVHCQGCRFGGEDAGVPIVSSSAAPKTVYPFHGPAIIIDDCETFAGPSGGADSGIVLLNGQIPKSISITRNRGPVDAPYIVNYGGQIASFPAYYAAFTAASAQEAWKYFSCKIDGNDSQGPDGSSSRIPFGMRPYVNSVRMTKVSRAAGLNLPANSATNIVNLDTLGEDTQGGWTAANPSRLYVPMGGTKMQGTVRFELDAIASAGLVAVQLLDAGGGVAAQESETVDINAATTAFILTIDIDDAPGAYYQLSVKNLTANAINMSKCVVKWKCVDYIA